MLAAPVVDLPPCAPVVRRIFKHPRVMHYNRLAALMLAVNIAVAVYGVVADNWWTSTGTDLRAIAMAAQVNLAVAVVVRQQYIINALAWLVTKATHIVAAAAALDARQVLPLRRPARRCRGGRNALVFRACRLDAA